MKEGEEVGMSNNHFLASFGTESGTSSNGYAPKTTHPVCALTSYKSYNGKNSQKPCSSQPGYDTMSKPKFTVTSF